MKTLKFSVFVLLVLFIGVACTDNSSEVDPLLEQQRGDQLELGGGLGGGTGSGSGTCDPLDSIPPSNFNISLSLGNIFWQDGMEVGIVSAGINTSFACDIEIDVEYRARKKPEGSNPPNIPWNTIIPVNPTISIPAGTTLSDFNGHHVPANYWGPCFKKTEYRITIIGVRFNGYSVDPSMYTIISGNDVTETLEYPTAENSCPPADKDSLPCDCVNYGTSSYECSFAIMRGQGTCEEEAGSPISTGGGGGVSIGGGG